MQSQWGEKMLRYQGAGLYMPNGQVTDVNVSCQTGELGDHVHHIKHTRKSSVIPYVKQEGEKRIVVPSCCQLLQSKNKKRNA